MKEQLLGLLHNSRSYTMAVAEAMPDNLYNSKPAENTWSFKEQLHHIAYGIEWWQDNFIKANKTEWNPPVVKKDKKLVIGYLRSAYDSLEATLRNGKLSDEAVKGFHATLDHITHHRGQAVLHLRCQGLTPPEYSY